MCVHGVQQYDRATESVVKVGVIVVTSIRYRDAVLPSDLPLPQTLLKVAHKRDAKHPVCTDEDPSDCRSFVI